MTQFDRQLARLQQQVDTFYIQPAEPMAKATLLGDQSPAPRMMSGEEFMAKALTSVGAGHISAAQLTEAEYCIRAGRRPPERILRAVVDGVEYNPFG